MTTTTTRLDLLRAVLAAPDDDAPRLAFADWLEENGDSDRSSFIRVQCELARYRIGSIGVGPDMGYQIARRDELRRRERELLEAFSGIREGDKSYSNRAAWSMPFRAASPSRWWERVAFRRGFISRITCTAADFLAVADRILWWPGLRCDVMACNGTGWVTGSAGLLERCDNCHGSGERPVTEAMMPIREVTLQTWPPYDWMAGKIRLYTYREDTVNVLSAAYPCIPPEGWHLPDYLGEMTAEAQNIGMYDDPPND